MRVPLNIKRLARMPLAVIGFFIFFVIVICAIFAPVIAPYDPLVMNSGHFLEGPSKHFLLGTDQMGRDVLSRIIYGSRVALIVSFGAVSFGIIVGAPIGLISAYIRGWTDAILMRIMDAIVSFPSLMIAIALVATMGNTLLNVIIAIGIANVPWIARVIRSQAMSVREQEYITAAKSIGNNNFRAIFFHIWPNSLAPIIVQGSLGMAYAILAEAALSFIGVGVPPPTPTWGGDLQFAFAFMNRAPVLSIAPGFAIFLLVLAFNFMGDALRDVFDPRLRGFLK